VRQPITLSTKKPLEQPLKIVMLSDLHIGYHNQVTELDRWIALINCEKPDLILIGGDIIDGHIRPLEDQKMAQSFHGLTAPMVACLGNHEYYTGTPKAQKFYQEAGITLLVDSVLQLKAINVIGRDDRSNPQRKSLEQLMAGVDKSKYTIVLDHQPYHLGEAEHCGADFQLSGHTHYGQLWPISWIEDAMYEDAFGPLQKGKTQYYVTSGIGIWGGKFRIGTHSEYLVATLKN
jgi:predicted MPP superfamily phosphohydrolase